MSWTKIGPSSNILSRDRQNSNLPNQAEEMFLSVKRKFKPFPDIQPKLNGHLSQSLRRGCQNWIQHKQRIMSRKKTVLKTLHFFIKFQLWVKNSQPWCKKLLSDLSENCILKDHKKNLQLNYSEKVDFLIFIGRDRNKFGLPGNSFRRVNKIAFTVTVGTLLGKKTSHQVIFSFSFLDNEFKFSGLLFKNIHRVCQSACIPPVQGNNFGKKLPKTLYFFYHFWKLNKLFRPVADAFSGVVQI